MSTIPNEVIEDIDPAEVGTHGCLIPTDDGESGPGPEESDHDD